MTTECLFCKIVAGEIPSDKVYEDEYSYAFLDITPINPGHVLLVPKEHSRNILDVSGEVLRNMMPALKNLSLAVKNSMNSDGINIHQNNESIAGQVIFHLHFHIIPRYSSDNLKMWHGKTVEEKSLKDMAEKIKKAL